MGTTVVSSRKRLGFTLVELMITVSIVGILAAISLPMLSTYVARSRATESTGFLAEIKSRQESYRSDFGMYCDVSGTYMNTWPAARPTGRVLTWASNPQWNMLGAAPPGRKTLFVYSSVAGPPGTNPTRAGYPDARGFDGLDFWFVTMAVGDVDADGITMMIESYSHSKATWSSAGDNAE
jgi:prepilin-type N-terminal cleavage/methylation domain-containing protein